MAGSSESENSEAKKNSFFSKDNKEWWKEKKPLYGKKDDGTLKTADEAAQTYLGSIANPAMNIGMISIWQLCVNMLKLSTGVRVGG